MIVSVVNLASPSTRSLATDLQGVWVVPRLRQEMHVSKAMTLLSPLLTSRNLYSVSTSSLVEHAYVIPGWM